MTTRARRWSHVSSGLQRPARRGSLIGARWATSSVCAGRRAREGGRGRCRPSGFGSFVIVCHPERRAEGPQSRNPWRPVTDVIPSRVAAKRADEESLLSGLRGLSTGTRRIPHSVHSVRNDGCPGDAKDSSTAGRRPSARNDRDVVGWPMRSGKRIPLVLAAVAVLACGGGSTDPAGQDTTTPTPPPTSTIPPGPYVAGQSYTGRNGYIEYIAGNAPVIYTAPHGGNLTPSEIPDRTAGRTPGSHRARAGQDAR